jgi:hypothetical protein
MLEKSAALPSDGVELSPHGTSHDLRFVDGPGYVRR